MIKSIAAFCLGFAFTFAFLAALSPDVPDRGFCPGFVCVSDGE